MISLNRKSQSEYFCFLKLALITFYISISFDALTLSNKLSSIEIKMRSSASGLTNCESSSQGQDRVRIDQPLPCSEQTFHHLLLDQDSFLLFSRVVTSYYP